MSARLQDDGDHVVLVVEDNGPGIDPSTWATHIYQANTSPTASKRWHRTRTRAGSRASCSKLMNGYVSHTTDQTLGGARFTARLPFLQAKSEEPDR